VDIDRDADQQPSGTFGMPSTSVFLSIVCLKNAGTLKAVFTRLPIAAIVFGSSISR
jgi:hypothetical protein